MYIYYTAFRLPKHHVLVLLLLLLVYPERKTAFRVRSTIIVPTAAAAATKECTRALVMISISISR
jgi:hypothetical protein